METFVTCQVVVIFIYLFRDDVSSIFVLIFIFFLFAAQTFHRRHPDKTVPLSGGADRIRLQHAS